MISLLYFATSRKVCQILQQRQRWYKYYEFKDKLFQELNTVLLSEDFQPF